MLSNAPPEDTEEGGKGWTFFTNHSHVLFYLHFHPDMPMREVAVHVGITERAVQRIIKELSENGVLTVRKVGRRNSYTVNSDVPLRHSIESHRTVGDLLAFIQRP